MSVWFCAPPSRWWRRQTEIRITVWPTWLAQRLCPHQHVKPFLLNDDDTAHTVRCEDCRKLLEVK